MHNCRDLVPGIGAESQLLQRSCHFACQIEWEENYTIMEGKNNPYTQQYQEYTIILHEMKYLLCS